MLPKFLKRKEKPTDAEKQAAAFSFRRQKDQIKTELKSKHKYLLNNVQKMRSSKASRSFGHFLIHGMQGAELGRSLGGTVGAVVVGFITMNAAGAKFGSIAFGGIFAAVGAIGASLLSLNEIYSELRGKPQPIIGMEKFKNSSGSILIRKAFADKERQALTTKAAIAFTKATDKTPECDNIGVMQMDHLCPTEKMSLVESMLPEYVTSLEIKSRTGKDYLHKNIHAMLNSLQPGVTDRVDFLFEQSPETALRAKRSYTGIHALLTANTVEELVAKTTPQSAPFVVPTATPEQTTDKPATAKPQNPAV